jgi:hypothetical protein
MKSPQSSDLRRGHIHIDERVGIEAVARKINGLAASALKVPPPDVASKPLCCCSR